MKNYKDSDYALNKYSEGIVYRFADGIVEYTLADYLAENTGKTEADFRALKALSDEIYHEQVIEDNRQNRENVSIHNMEESEDFGGDTLEDVVIERPEREAVENQRRELASRAFDKLTEAQRRRYLMYYVDGMTLRQIAESEGVVHSKIQNSINAADKKIKKVLSGSKK